MMESYAVALGVPRVFDGAAHRSVEQARDVYAAVGVSS